jgi:HTH-type transcriptional regulator/antitoxin HipB
MRSPRIGAHEKTMKTKMLSDTISTTKELGQLIRQRRKSLGLSIEDAAAWCNVGTRFLFDIENAKPTVEFQKTVMTAARLGIRLHWSEHGQSTPNSPVPDLVLSAPPFDSGHWVASRKAAISAAVKCGIPMPSIDVNSGHAGVMTITVRRGASDRALIAVPLPDTPKREQDGGPNLIAIFREIDLQSARPLPDVMLALKWALFTYLIGDTNVSAADVFMQDDGAGELRIAPFAVPACCPFSIPNTSEYAGLRIGREWPSDWLRVDPWLVLAHSIQVRPRVVFTLMEEMAEIVPSAVHSALSSIYNSPMLRGPAALMSKTAGARAMRMNDLRKAAASQGIAGVPKPAPVPKEVIKDENVPYLGHETTYE